MVPVGSTPVIDLKSIGVVFPGGYGKAWVPVHVIWGGESMPVEDEGVVNPVLHADTEGLPSLDSKERGGQLSLHQ
jgi:hypothetical protein